MLHNSLCVDMLFARFEPSRKHNQVHALGRFVLQESLKVLDVPTLPSIGRLSVAFDCVNKFAGLDD